MKHAGYKRCAYSIFSICTSSKFCGIFVHLLSLFPPFSPWPSFSPPARFPCNSAYKTKKNLKTQARFARMQMNFSHLATSCEMNFQIVDNSTVSHHSLRRTRATFLPNPHSACSSSVLYSSCSGQIPLLYRQHLPHRKFCHLAAEKRHCSGSVEARDPTRATCYAHGPQLSISYTRCRKGTCFTNSAIDVHCHVHGAQTQEHTQKRSLMRRWFLSCC